MEILIEAVNSHIVEAVPYASIVPPMRGSDTPIHSYTIHIKKNGDVHRTWLVYKPDYARFHMTGGSTKNFYYCSESFLDDLIAAVKGMPFEFCTEPIQWYQ